ncbi:hypothetical protein QUF63_14435 [Anaerolineales bacterium HSG25]|nr:hypothetical protein [Anaerolineales bacterium HSG25]
MIHQYSFTDLLPLWRQNQFTLEEVVEPIILALMAFKDRAHKLDYKLLVMTVNSGADADVVETIVDEFIDYQTIQLMDKLPQNKAAAHQAVNHILERFTLMELRLLHMEREYEMIADDLDTTSYLLN